MRHTIQGVRGRRRHSTQRLMPACVCKAVLCSIGLLWRAPLCTLLHVRRELTVSGVLSLLQQQPPPPPPPHTRCHPVPTCVCCRCYKYRVTVFCPWTNKIEVVEATDPYSKCTTGE